VATARRRASLEDLLPLPAQPSDGQAGAWELLIPFLSEPRVERIRQVLASRCGRLLLVLDNLYDPHNLSATLRTAEAFGLQHVVLTGSAPDRLNPQVALGAQRWLTVRREPDASACCAALKEAGYMVAASVLTGDAMAPSAFEPSGPVALVVGNEHEGLGRAWVEGADVRLRVPMRGFAQSLNVSVAAGVLMALLLDKPALSIRGLPEAEARVLADAWIRKSVPHAERILARLRGQSDR